MITRLAKFIHKKEEGAGPKKLILIFAGIVAAGFFLANMLIASSLNLYADSNGSLAEAMGVNNIQGGQNFAGSLPSGEGTFLMFEFDHPSLLDQLMSFGGDVMSASFGG